MTRAKPLILVVDDEGSFLEIITAKLSAAGFDVATAKDEAEALSRTKELMPDLVLMDIYMPPGETGTDAALAIKQNPETKNVKIVFLTNLEDPWPTFKADNQKIAKSLGMEDFLRKDQLDNLIPRVRELLART